ncbi:MAG: EAL domain-containing protein [Myxococcales bacterium]|nr:EAL domain-containing protein [Myxococcales bacterium]
MASPRRRLSRSARYFARSLSGSNPSSVELLRGLVSFICASPYGRSIVGGIRQLRQASALAGRFNSSGARVSGSRGDDISVVLIDDDPLVRSLVSQALRGSYTVSSVATGTEGLALLARDPPDLVLLDVDLPDIDGFTVCRKLRAHYTSEELPVLMLTGNQDDSAVEAAFEAGATDFLAKPVSVPLLRQRLRFAFRAAGAFQRVIENERRLARGHELAGIGQFEWHVGPERLVCTPQALRILGSPESPPASLEEFFLNHVHPEDAARARALFSNESLVEAEIRLGAEGDAPTVRIYLEVAARPSGKVFFVTMHDISGSVGDPRHKLAYYDAATGLPNRQLFESRLDAALQSSAAQRYAVLFADIDGFKNVNDTLGHLAGDELLRHAAARLLASLRINDSIGRMALSGSVGRWGGDEFAVLVGPIASARDAEHVAARILQQAAEPVRMGGRDQSFRLSIGIAIYPDHGRTRHELIRKADKAMYEAKRAGGNSARLYEPVMEVQATRRSAIEADLPQALEAGQLWLAYQPRFTLDTLAINGAEALLRWNHPTLAAVRPNEFIGVAERNRSILEIGRWVIEQAAAELSRWRAAGVADLRVSVNVSPIQLRGTDFIRGLTDALVETQIRPQQIELEITESILLEQTREVTDNLRAIRDMGVGLAIDDFGTGYSSLSALLAMPLTAVKLDRSIVLQIEGSAGARSAVQAIVTMCRGIGCTFVAEGIDSEEQVRILRELGCTEGQGFWFSEPVAAHKFLERVRAQPNR